MSLLLEQCNFEATRDYVVLPQLKKKTFDPKYEYQFSCPEGREKFITCFMDYIEAEKWYRANAWQFTEGPSTILKTKRRKI